MKKITIVVGHYSNVEVIISKEKKCLYDLLVVLVISNIFKGVAYDLRILKNRYIRQGNISNEIKEPTVSEMCVPFQTYIRNSVLKVYL